MSIVSTGGRRRNCGATLSLVVFFGKAVFAVVVGEVGAFGIAFETETKITTRAPR